ncbi:Ribose import permease protein RbsC [subsurface metagenome]
MFHLFRTVFRDAAAREMEMLKRGGRSRLLRYIDILGPWVGVILFAIVVALQTPAFLSLPNITSVIMTASSYIILAIGMTFVITGAGIDLSIGSILALSGAAMTVLMKHTPINPILAIVVCLAVGASLGLVNGLLITKLKMPDFVATLATMLVYRGITLLIIGGRVLYGFPKSMIYLGQARWGAVPVCIIVALLVVVVADFLLYKRTRFGRYTVAIGGNRTAAIHAGIPVDRYKIYTYIFSGFMAALAGVVLIGRLDSYVAVDGAYMLLPTIAAVVMGGTALYGGVGRLWGSLGGALLLAMVINGMVLLGLGFFWQQVAVGVVIVLAIMVYTVTGLRQSRGVGGGG